MRTLLALTVASIATAAVPALAACFETFAYVEARLILASLPTPRERAALADPRLEAAYDAADDALIAFLDTANDRECDDAKAARDHLNDTIDDLVLLGGLEAGKCCSSWNTGTGGTNCTPTTDDTCPGDLFYCEVRADGTCF